jgi:xanthine dehydrogenase accessory factor
VKRALLNALLAAKKERRAVAIITQIASGAQRMVSREQGANDPLGNILEEAFRFDQSGQSVIPMAVQAGYDVSVIDPRGAFATGARFPDISLHVQWPEEILPSLGLDARTALLALTHDPKIDDPALNLALHSECFYIGALGSKKTQASRCARLKEMGLSDEKITRIHGPIGLAIGAKGAAEIAISIMAEMTRTLRLGA